jgi:hydroxyacylglutathione hydrolase
VLVPGFPSAAFGTNVYVLAPAEGEQCLIVDPGIEVSDGVDELLARHRLEPVAVLLTHGHLDHTFSVVPVGTRRGIPAYIHSADRDWLRDPAQAFGPQMHELFGGRLEWQEPDDVVTVGDGDTIELAGLSLVVDHAPGHTPGSAMFRLAGAPDGVRREDDARVPSQTLISGDVLFAGSIGRTDLPGGSLEQMMASLAHRVWPLADDVLVLPGHGPATTIGRERVTNPYLQAAADEASSPTAAPSRGL